MTRCPQARNDTTEGGIKGVIDQIVHEITTTNAPTIRQNVRKNKEIRRKSSVDVAEFSASRAHDIRDRNLAPQTVPNHNRGSLSDAPSVQCIFIRRAATYVEEGRSSSGVFRLLGRVDLNANAASCKGILVLGAQLLPIVPELIDHLRKVPIRPQINE